MRAAAAGAARRAVTQLDTRPSSRGQECAPRPCAREVRTRKRTDVRAREGRGVSSGCHDSARRTGGSWAPSAGP